MSKINNSRQETLKRIVENYYSQLEIVGRSDMTLHEYLRGIKTLSFDDIEFALYYNMTR